jgi:hypothetical protein
MVWNTSEQFKGKEKVKNYINHGEIYCPYFKEKYLLTLKA